MWTVGRTRTEAQRLVPGMRREELRVGPVPVGVLVAAGCLPLVAERLPVIELGAAPLLRRDLRDKRGLCFVPCPAAH